MLDKDVSDSTANDDTPVTLEDQTRINQFSQLNAHYDELTERLELVQKELEDVEELEPELELMDDDDEVMYKLDSSFLRLPASEVLTLLQSSLEKLNAEAATLRSEREECDQGMTKLKGLLYAKFGSQYTHSAGPDRLQRVGSN
ncbi:BZ3500_MvSof-1268-A1-R1_Chr9g10562 [Microbotryum saponariae]|uniref:Prefoldin subunit 4 n=1 Tax=Microbotryum saponariae TaxID=289078 RepID=A0A2X0M610_9BASI|nr:BZ3501_MvSof-1269-A2-R1_Chr9g10311 [Microbotryum saponariae]SDA00301.1 BZ3500_MvSof-1268-A1-R1_Chr9g10562 [Microbotryum saponariae]